MIAPTLAKSVLIPERKPLTVVYILILILELQNKNLEIRIILFQCLIIGLRSNFLYYKSINNVTVTVVAPCVDSDNGAKNIFEEGCTMYTEGPYSCGQYGDSDFDSDTMCCACGGGINGNITDI